MALTDLERVRLKIADRPHTVIGEIVGTGDGTTTIWRLLGAPVTAGSEAITVNGVAQTDPTHYSLNDATGQITFVAAPTDTHEILASYTWSVFSDDELNDALTNEGTVNGAAAEAIRWILADVERFIKYTLGQESVDRTKTRDSLTDMLNRLEEGSGPIGIVMASTDAELDSMAPFIEQDEDIADAITI